MQLHVNGERKDFPGSLTVVELLDALGIQKDRVAVELNRAVLPRARHAETRLSDGDEVELVTFVGGG